MALEYINGLIKAGDVEKLKNELTKVNRILNETITKIKVALGVNTDLRDTTLYILENGNLDDELTAMLKEILDKIGKSPSYNTNSLERLEKLLKNYFDLLEVRTAVTQGINQILGVHSEVEGAQEPIHYKIFVNQLEELIGSLRNNIQ